MVPDAVISFTDCQVYIVRTILSCAIVPILYNLFTLSIKNLARHVFWLVIITRSSFKNMKDSCFYIIIKIGQNILSVSQWTLKKWWWVFCWDCYDGFCFCEEFFPIAISGTQHSFYSLICILIWILHIVMKTVYQTIFLLIIWFNYTISDGKAPKKGCNLLMYHVKQKYNIKPFDKWSRYRADKTFSSQEWYTPLCCLASGELIKQTQVCCSHRGACYIFNKMASYSETRPSSQLIHPECVGVATPRRATCCEPRVTDILETNLTHG